MNTLKTRFLLLFFCALCAEALSQSQPNIVFFYIDDWSWNGSPLLMDESMPNSGMPALEMPNLEKIASQGMKFRNAYGSPQCAPARVCIQTGQSSPRSGFTVYMNGDPENYYDGNNNWLGFPVVPNVSDLKLDDDATTIPEALKPLGYVSAHIGKWHMRGNPSDEGYVLHDGNTDNKPGQTLDRDANRIPENMSDPKLMFSITEKAIGFIEEQAKRKNPFYVQLSHYAMHAWSESLAETREKYASHPLLLKWYQDNNMDADKISRKQDPAAWLAMGEDLDGRIGEVLDKLKELGIEENTYIVVAGDNGYRHRELGLDSTLTQPLHGHKWWVWDGGLRVPMFVKGPGIRPGSVFYGNVVNYDFLPTFVEWAGGNPKSLKNIDGVSLASYTSGKEPEDDFLNRNLYFHYPHYRESVPHSAVISGNYKVMHFYSNPEIPMLFDLSKDIGEVSNIAETNSRIHQKMHGDMLSYFEEVGARIPKINPDYNQTEYEKDRKTQRRMEWGPFLGERNLEEDER